MNKCERYLNDHLAGSIVALEIAHRRAAIQGDDETGRYLRTFVEEVARDQRSLRAAMASLDAAPSLVKESLATATAWLDRLRATFDLPGAPDLLRDLELLTLGVRGKDLLWSSLETIGATSDTPLAQLRARAREQIAGLERLHEHAVARELGQKTARN